MALNHRFAAFKRVLIEAAQQPPPSPAYYAYRAATTGEDRRTAHAAMTASDERYLWADVHQSIDAQLKRVSDERRGIERDSKARAAAERETRRAVDNARIMTLPPTRQALAKTRRALIATVGALATGIMIIFIGAFIVGNVVNFVASLIYAWYLWAALFGSLFAIWGILSFAVHWRVVFSVTRAIPTALRAAMVG